jgi:hypothetical protein
MGIAAAIIAPYYGRAGRENAQNFTETLQKASLLAVARGTVAQKSRRANPVLLTADSAASKRGSGLVLDSFRAIGRVYCPSIARCRLRLRDISATGARTARVLPNWPTLWPSTTIKALFSNN